MLEYTNPYVCADIGVNWHGEYSTLERMIQGCADAGVSAVKLQLFDEKIAKESSVDIEDMVLTAYEVDEIHEITKEMGVDLVLTPMYLKILDDLEDYKDSFESIKIRSKDWCNRELIARAREFEKQMFISVPVIGGAVHNPHLSPDEFQEAVINTRRDGAFRIYCVPYYPPKLEELKLSQVIFYDGYSNHFPDINIPLLAVALKEGYNISIRRKTDFYLEVHAREAADITCVDYAVSLDIPDIGLLMKGINAFEEGA